MSRFLSISAVVVIMLLSIGVLDLQAGNNDRKSKRVYSGGPIDFEDFDIGIVQQPLVIGGVSFEGFDFDYSTLLIGPDPTWFLSVGGLDGTQALEYLMSASWTPGYVIRFNPPMQSVQFDVLPYSSITEVRVRAYSPGSSTVVLDQLFPVPGVILVEAEGPFGSLRVGDGSGGYFSIDNFDLLSIFVNDFESADTSAWSTTS